MHAHLCSLSVTCMLKRSCARPAPLQIEPGPATPPTMLNVFNIYYRGTEVRQGGLLLSLHDAVLVPHAAVSCYTAAVWKCLPPLPLHAHQLVPLPPRTTPHPRPTTSTPPPATDLVPAGHEPVRAQPA